MSRPVATTSTAGLPATVLVEAIEALGLPNELVAAYVTGRWPELEKGEGQ